MRVIGGQFARFCVVGAVCTVLNYGVFWLLHQTLGVDYLAASGAGYMAGVVLGYGLNRWWTFAAAEKRPFIGYAALYLVTLGVSLLLMRLLVEMAGVPAALAQLLVILVTTILNFVGSKYLVFKV